ncbi:prealbumin-like fold domain-containing protein [Clostridium folliculivorans]|uniref:Prealbumin-like fold domain-containing protein n=1 Tax=Clostridium folliculivorans TaxID=2886038 RepID=A0A9W5Y329_9CLOT|nr:prealbumin-like fold domain-containing protein [Clostridium folliculivorans]GKU25721.1 hypothetical protein CFOLD11_25470 [Clostridium folliculivorans]GKU28743.1 hypothetical protein CFB3_08490 [Clostridium folliculivorans]
MGMKFSDNLYNNETLEWLNGNYELGSDFASNNQVNIENNFDVDVDVEQFNEATIREEKRNSGCKDNQHDQHHDDCHDDQHHDDCHDDHHHERKGGKIVFTSRLISVDGEPISGVRVFLLRLDTCGCETKFCFVSSKITDRNGRAVFEGLRDGIYKVVQPIDKCVFRDPIYVPSDQVTIDRNHRERQVTAINRIRKEVLANFNQNRCCNNFNNCCGSFGNNCGGFNDCGCGFDGFWILLLLFGFCGCGFWFI